MENAICNVSHKCCYFLHLPLGQYCTEMYKKKNAVCAIADFRRKSARKYFRKSIAKLLKTIHGKSNFLNMPQPVI